MTIFLTHSEKQTFDLGGKIAQKLQGGETIGLTGNLGAGKTVFIKGLAKGLGVRQMVTSPTFVLMKIYKINSKNKNLVHIDAYRLENGQNLTNIGVEDYLKNKNTITVIEWAEKVKKILPKDAISVKITIGKEINQRIIEIRK